MEVLWEQNTQFPIRSEGKNRIPFRDIGWWPGDAKLLELTDRSEYSEKIPELEPRWWIPHRIRFLEAHGLDIHAEVWDYIEKPWGNRSVVPAPGDGLVLNSDLYDENSDPASVDLFQIACLSAKTKIPFEDLLARIDRYSVLGVEIPRRSGPNIALSSSDLQLLSCDISGSYAFRWQTDHAASVGKRYNPEFSGTRLVLVSATLNKTLGAIWTCPLN